MGWGVLCPDHCVCPSFLWVQISLAMDISYPFIPSFLSFQEVTGSL